MDAAEAAQTNAITVSYRSYADGKKDEALTVAAADVRSYSYSKAGSPDENASYDPARTPVSTTTPFYTDAGDRRSVKGTKRWKLSIELGSMAERDRAFVCDMQVGNGLDGPSIVDLYPNDPSHERARDHRMYGGLVQTVAMRRPNFARHATTPEWETM